MSNPERNLSVILGCQGTSLTADERAFFAEIRPFGFILFARNIENPVQLRALTSELRSCLDQPDAPILIDQEGGRVQRMRPPHWRPAPPMKVFGDLHKVAPNRAREALSLNIQLLASELISVGISVDCAPLLDVSNELTHNVIGDRAFAEDADVVSDLGQVAVEAFLANGVLPVMKHVPGHGRATVDSHKDLPRVNADRALLSKTDFKPFHDLWDCPLAMTAHIVYEAIDPDNPATTSKIVINDVIRREIGFQGLLISDDLSMQALSGDFEARAKHSLEAGCDLALHCNGDRGEMEAVVRGVTPLTSEQWSKWRDMQSRLGKPVEFDPAEASEKLQRWLRGVL